MMVSAKDAVVVCKGKGVYVVKIGDDLLSQKRIKTWGACTAGWREQDDESIYKALAWLALELIEFNGIPARRVRDAFEDFVEGYREWSDACARTAITLR